MSQLIQCARCGKLFDSNLRSCFHCGETKCRYVNCKKCKTAIPEFEAQYWQTLHYPPHTGKYVPTTLCKACKQKAPEIISDQGVIFNSVQFTCQTCKHNFTKTAKFSSKDTWDRSANTYGAYIYLNPKLEDRIGSKYDLEQMSGLKNNFYDEGIGAVSSCRYPLRIQYNCQCPKCGGQSVSALMDYPYVRCKLCGGLTERKNSFVKSSYFTREGFNLQTSWKGREYYSWYIDSCLKVEHNFLDYYHKFCYDFFPEEPLVSFDEINSFISKYYSNKIFLENFYFAIRCILYYSVIGIFLKNPTYLFLIGSALACYDYGLFYKEKREELEKYHNKSINSQDLYFIVSLYYQV